MYIALSLLFFLKAIVAECNGGSELCQRTYDNITHLVTHNSYALTPQMGATQDHSILDQLNDGVRGIKLSAVPSSTDPSVIQLCHTYCAVLDAGPASDTLSMISGWLKENPKEVVTIMWNNLYNMKPAQFLSAYEQSGIMPYVYTHPNPTEAWPSLQAMIDSNQRLVNFVDVEADVGQVPWLMDQFSQVFETPYENTETFNCNIDRISQDLDPKHMMYVLNHFLYGTFEMGTIKIHMPLKDKAEVANGRASLDEHVLNCSDVFQKKPNFVEVDFYSIGQSLSVVAELNGVSTQQLTPKTDVKTDHAVLVHKNGLLPTDHVLIDNSLSKGVCLRPNLQSICLKLLLFNMVYRGIF